MLLFAAAFSGAADGYDASPVRLVTGRVEFMPIKHIHMGADVAWRTSPNFALWGAKLPTNSAPPIPPPALKDVNNRGDEYIQRDSGIAYSGDINLFAAPSLPT